MKAHALLAIWLVLAIAASAVELSPKPARPSKPLIEIPVYELPKTGKNIPRDGAGWLNVEASGTRLVVRFFDAENKPLSPDVDRGFARFRYGAKIATYAILNREGEALVTPATVRPPHNFLVMLSFFGGGCIEAGEFYHLKYP